MIAFGLNRSLERPSAYIPSLAIALCGCLGLLAGNSFGAQPSATPAPPAGKETAPKQQSNTNALAEVSKPGKWIDLFDGESLAGWKVTDFAGTGEVGVKKGQINLGMGYMTGITWTNPLPARINYEIELDAMRTEGSDFFCGLTFPVGENPCSLIVGGWGGGVVGLSSLDGEDAANNESTHYMNFEKNRWYHIRLRVVPDKIQAWIQDEKVVDVLTKEKRLSIRIEVEASLPLGIATWSTGAAIRDIRLKKL